MKTARLWFVRLLSVLLVAGVLAGTTLALGARAQTPIEDPALTEMLPAADAPSDAGGVPTEGGGAEDGNSPIIVAGIDLRKLDFVRLLSFDTDYIIEIIDQVDLSEVSMDQLIAAAKASAKAVIVLLLSVGGIVISILGFLLIQVLKAILLVSVNLMAQRMSVQNRRTLPLGGMDTAPTVKNFDAFALERAERGSAYRDLLTDIKRRLGHLKEKMEADRWATVQGLYETSPRFEQVRKDLEELVGMRDHVRNEISHLIHARKARFGLLDANMDVMRHYADNGSFFKGFWRKRVIGFRRVQFHGFKLWLLPRFTTLGGDRRIVKRIAQFNKLENECVRMYNILVEEFSSFADTLKVRLKINLSTDLPQPVFIVSGERLVGAEVEDPFHPDTTPEDPEEAEAKAKLDAPDGPEDPPKCG